MPKQGQRAEVNAFVKGLITEASPLNFPANASKSEENFELNRDGTRDRRFGMSYESGFSLIPLQPEFTDTSGITTFKWGAVAGVTTTEFLVIQFGNKLSFFNINSSNLSTNGVIGSIILTNFPSDVVYSFSAIQGSLIVAAGSPVIKAISYNASSNTFSEADHSLLVRDVWGIEVTGSQYETDPSFRGAPDNRHTYNLHNQSWGIPRRTDTTALKDPLNTYNTAFGVHPSDTEVIWTGIQFTPGTGGADPYERMFTNLYSERLGADVKAAKGYFLIDLLRRGTSRSIALNNNYIKYPQITVNPPNFPSDVTPGGASLAVEFAGRVFYSGFSGEVLGRDARSPTLSNFVAFSQLVNSISDIKKCYQDGDPTSRENTDLLDTDGGFIRISGAKNIVSIENMETHLVVIADNGIWAISGGSDFGFSATNYKVSKISSYGGVSKSSIVTEGGKKFFWADDGIYVIAKNQYGDLEVNSITQTTIQKLFNAIPSNSKKSAIGVYDPSNKKLRWIYKDSDGLTDKELILDLTLSAFYQHRIMRITGSSPSIVGMFTSMTFGQPTPDTTVASVADDVLSNTDTVVIPSTSRASGVQSVRYLTRVPSTTLSFTFSVYTNSQFIDWKDFNGVGVDALAFLEAGQSTATDSAILKQIPYLVIHFLRTEDGVSGNLPTHPSSCLIRSMWDWSNSSNSKKWSNFFQAYRYRKAYIPIDASDTFNNGFEIVKTKNKLRGRGNAFSLRMETEPLHDCRILGWSLTVNANSIT